MNKATKEKELKIYAIDTTGPFCSVALLVVKQVEDDEKLNTNNIKHFQIIEKQSQEKISHVSQIIPLTNEVLKEGKTNIKEIDAIAVSIGPGSYTGIRVGVSVARALGQALDKPIIPISSLDAFAYSRTNDFIVCPIINARRKQVYAGAYMGKLDKFLLKENEKNKRDDSINYYDYVCKSISYDEKNWKDDKAIIDEGPYIIDEFLDNIIEKITNDDGLREKTIVLYGDGIEAYESEVEKFNNKLIFNEETKKIKCVFSIENCYQRAGLVALNAYEKYFKNELKPYYEIFPNYMRKAEAEQKLEERKKEIRDRLNIRKITVEDLPQIVLIEKECFPDPWNEEMYRKEIEENHLANYICATYEDEIVGYGGLWVIGREGHITNIAVSPKYEKNGIGYKVGESLMEYAEKKERKRLNFTLEVRESNMSAIKLYEKLGFVNVGKRPNYYGNEDAVIMWKINIEDISTTDRSAEILEK